jgi:hypothetical protein
VRFAVPEFHVFNHASLAGEINRASVATIGNYRADGQFFRRAISEVNDNTIEFDGAATDTKLNCAEAAIVFADVDFVVVVVTIHVRFAQINPFFRVRFDGEQAEEKQAEHQDRAIPICSYFHSIAPQAEMILFKDRAETLAAGSNDASSVEGKTDFLG